MDLQGDRRRIVEGRRVRVEHGGRAPQVDVDAWVAESAVLSGDVHVGPGARILHGAVLTAELGATLVVGAGCIVMEQAVLRASGRFSLSLGDHSLVGPHAYLTGCTVGAKCFIATGAMIFNGARIGEGTTVALGGVVHVGTALEAESWVQIGHVAAGRPSRILPPHEAEEIRSAIGQVGFLPYVFGIEQGTPPRAKPIGAAVTRYGRALAGHLHDRVLADEVDG